MTFAIEIDAQRWRAHLEKFVTDFKALDVRVLPVVKSHGYGLGAKALAEEVTRLGLPALAVGTIFEAKDMLQWFGGDIVVLEPFNAADADAAALWDRLATEQRLIRTVESPDDNPQRVRYEVAGAMNRFGAAPEDLPEGCFATVHPSNPPALTDIELIAQLLQAGHGVSVSHLWPAHFKALPGSGAQMELRSGTALWLGDRRALHASGTVLAIHQATRSTMAGYRARSVRRGRAYAVVSGGTAHGIGLEASGGATTLRQRVIALVDGVLSALGKSRSPFKLQGKKLWFVEPPHQHVSMVWLPRSASLAVGDQLPATVRFTTTRADVVRFRD